MTAEDQGIQDNPVADLTIGDAPTAFHNLSGRFVPLDHGQFGYADLSV